MARRLLLISVSLLACGGAERLEKPSTSTDASPSCPGVTALQARSPRPGTGLTQQQGQEQQGQEQQGCQQQGTQLVGASITLPVSSAYAGWFNRRWLKPARIIRGQLAGDGGELMGKGLVGSWIPSDDAGSAVWLIVRSASSDPTYPDGSTWLYGIDVYDSQTGTSSPFCAADAKGVAGAIPIAATFDGSGSRVESSKQFTFACTAGVMAKCYRWGYRPWLTDASGSPLSFSNLHWACTRMARADYCGNGRSWTQNGTTINVWDTAPSPGPFQAHGPTDPTFVFEAGWSTSGAVCLSKERWATLNPQVAQDCPDRLIPPGAATQAGTVCESPTDAISFNPSIQLFNESRINVAP